MNWLLRAFVRIYRSSRRFERRFTLAGMAVLYTLIAAVVFGIDTQQTMAFQIFSLACALLVVGALWSVRFRPRIELRRVLPEFATAGEPFAYRQVVRLTQGAPRSGLKLRDELTERFPSTEDFRRRRGADPSWNWVDRRIGYPRWLEAVRRGRGASIEEISLPTLAAGRSVEVRMPVTPLRRGILHFARTWVLRPDPLGLVNALAAFSTPQSLVVLARRYPVPQLALPGARRYQKGGVALSQNVGDSQEFMGLRDYRPGDALRHIHWRSFARVGKPVVKEYHDEFFTRYGLVLDTFGDVPEAVFDAAVSVATSFVAAVTLRDALLDLMFVEDRAYRFTVGRGVGQPHRLLRVLAAVEPSREQDFKLLADQVADHARALSAAVIVLLAIDEPRREMLRALESHRVGLVTLLVSPRPPAAGHALQGLHWIDPADVEASLARIGQ